MTRTELLTFLTRHRLGVLATGSPAGDPGTAVVRVAVTDELELIFDTIDTTQNVRTFAEILKSRPSQLGPI